MVGSQEKEKNNYKLTKYVKHSNLKRKKGFKKTNCNAKVEKSSIKHNAINKIKYKYSPKKEANSKMEFVAAVTKIKKTNNNFFKMTGRKPYSNARGNKEKKNWKKFTIMIKDNFFNCLD